MSANFDWQTEEDDRRRQESLWDDTPDSPGEQPERRRPWRMIGLIAALILVAGAVIWWRVDKRIDATLEAFRTDIIASHNLVQRAVAEGDEEIFRSVLSGRMPAWTAAELEVFSQQLVYDRTPLGLIPVEGSLPVILPSTNEEIDADKRAAQIELSPDLNEAIVVAEHPFLVETSGETVVLQQTSVFRRGDSRWLLSPPLDEFWGDWLTAEGEYLSIIYPRRDDPVARRLITDLDAAIDRMCAALEDIDCSNDLFLTVRLDTDPSSLAALSQPFGAVQRAREQGDILELPAPTLVGLPVDDNERLAEAGYSALADGYSRHVVGAAIAQAVGWNCCDNALLFSILVEQQLGELGIAEWPIDMADHQQVLNTRVRLSDLSHFMRGRFAKEISDERMWELRAAVDFLANGMPGVSVADMQRMLDGSRSFGHFLERIANFSRAENDLPIPNNLDLAWWLFAFTGEPGVAEPPTTAPTESLYLSCTAAEGNQPTDTSKLLRYSPEQGNWAELYTLPGFIWMSALPDPQTLLMQEFALEEETWRANIWRDGAVVPAYVSEGGRYAISFGETDPTGSKMVAYSFDNDEGIVSGFLVNLDACADGCATSELPGRPFWSPDSRHALYLGDSETYPADVLVTSGNRYIILQTSEGPRDYSLTLGDGDARPSSPSLRTVGDGHSPFWLDDETYGYIRQAGSGVPAALADHEIVLATLDEPNPFMTISAADLYEFLPETIPARRLSLAYVATHPQQPDKMFIVLLDTQGLSSYVILYDLQTRLPEVRLSLLYNLNHSLGFSPDGRYLILTGQDRNVITSGESSAMLLLHEIETNHTIPLLSRMPFFLPSVVYDWTEDSRWLSVAMEDNLIGLIAPDEGLSQLLPHSYGACTSVAWLQE